MYERINRLYEEGKLDKQGVANAVMRGWITSTQYEEITGEPYEA